MGVDVFVCRRRVAIRMAFAVVAVNGVGAEEPEDTNGRCALATSNEDRSKEEEEEEELSVSRSGVGEGLPFPRRGGTMVSFTRRAADPSPPLLHSSVNGKVEMEVYTGEMDSEGEATAAATAVPAGGLR